MRRRPLTALAAALVAPSLVLGLVSAQAGPAAAGGTSGVAPVPTDLRDPAVRCTAVSYVSTTTPTFSAVTTDAVDHRPSLEFDLADGAGVHTRHTVDTGGDLQPGTWTPTLPGDGVYAWKVRNISGSGATTSRSAWSATQRFVLDTVAPATATTSSDDYPPDLWGAPTGRTISSTSPSGRAVGYAYGWDTGAPAVSGDTCGATVGNDTRTGYDTDGTFSAPTFLEPGRHVLTTAAFDAAHNVAAATSYAFYVSPGVTSATGPLPTRLEGETLPLVAATTTAVTYPEERPRAAAGAQLHIVPSTSSPALGQRVTATLTVGTEGDYALSTLLSTGPFYGKVAFDLDGGPLEADGAAVVDAYRPGAARTRPPRWVDLGGRHLTRGTHALGIILSGRTATRHHDPVTGTDDQGYAVGLDVVTLAPVGRFTTASFADALDNHGIVDTDRSVDPVDLSADLGRTPDRLNLSLRSLRTSAAGLNRGAPVTIDGVAFRLPRATGADEGYADNVVAFGQTIPVDPTPRPLRSIDLVVAAACGDVAPPPDGRAGDVLATFGITHQGDGEELSSAPRVPTVPDLLHPASTTATSVVYDPPSSATEPWIVSGWQLPYADRGTTPARTLQPWVYHLRIPVNPNYAAYPVVSLTLPSLRTPFTGACGPSLHVLALTPVA